MKQSSKLVLLGSVFVAAACGLVYELVAGALSSYIMGDAVTQFSLVIGVFLSAMGIGSYLARFFKERLLHTFINLEILIGLVGGSSSIFLYMVSAFASPIFPPLFYTLCASLGILIGIEVPILVRIINKDGGLSEALSNVLALDYVGALAGSILFPFLILPFAGLTRSSLVFGILNLIVAGAAFHLLERKARPRFALRLGSSVLALFVLLLFSTQLVAFFEDMLYQDEIIYAKTTKYQRLVLTRWKDDIRLYIEGNIQFSSIDEARYHESLVLPAMSSHPHPVSALILGGGDGMAAREILKYESVERIDLVDIDPEITRIAKEREELLHLNKGSLHSPKVRVFNDDAFRYLRESSAFYDVIIIDLPDPNSDTLSKLYSDSFYTLCYRRLTAQGVLVTQATSPYYAPKAFWCIVHTLEAAGANFEAHTSKQINVHPYHVNVPSFGEWGFVLASKNEVQLNSLSPECETAFLTAEVLQSLFHFPKDIVMATKLDVNTLENRRLFYYYNEGWKNFNQ